LPTAFLMEMVVGVLSSAGMASPNVEIEIAVSVIVFAVMLGLQLKTPPSLPAR
jgi:hydrogenase/urease accessory protein HupE